MNEQQKPVSITKNYIYNTLYQILAVIIPLVTTPYAARIFNVEGVGIQSYVTSAATVFSQIAALGVLIYGQREIAQNRDSREKTSHLFWEIELLCVVTTLLTTAAWVAFAFLENSYTPYLLVSSMTVLAVAFDITWFFAGLEQFRLIVLRNTAVKLIGLALLFAAVKQESDLLLYIALLAATGMLGNMSMWTHLPHYLTRPNWRKLRPFRHLRQTFVYFIPTIASTAYTYVDKTMLRFLTNGTVENGYYEQTTKIVRTAQVLLTSINTVMASRMSYLFSQGKFKEMKQNLYASVDFILLLAFPFTFGIIGVSGNFVDWFLGEGFEPVTRLLWVFGFLLIITGISNCLSQQYLTPSGQRGRSSKGIVLGAVVNICLNFLMIPAIGAFGATVASVIAELTILIVYLYMSKPVISVSVIVKKSAKRFVAALGMLAAVIATQYFPVTGVLLTLLQVAVGALVYVLLLLLLLKDRLLIETLTKVISKYRSRKQG